MALPGFLKQVAFQVQCLVATPQHLEHWRSTISAWAKSDEVQQRYETVTTMCKEGDELKTDENEYALEPSPLVPLRPSLGYEYALLAAASNAVASDTEDSTAIIIDPFSQDSVKTIKGKPEGVARSGPYTLLKIRIQDGDISEADVERLNEFLANIRDDLEANAPAPQGASQSAAGGSEDQNKTQSAKKPSDNAFIAWRLRTYAGIKNQTEIAEKMQEQSVPAKQGQVSRWLSEVDAWVAAGNVIHAPPPLTSQPQSMDPNDIDMGERQDGLTPRQRQKRRF